jgi:hypothetical protein
MDYRINTKKRWKIKWQSPVYKILYPQPFLLVHKDHRDHRDHKVRKVWMVLKVHRDHRVRKDQRETLVAQHLPIHLILSPLEMIQELAD